MACLVWDSPRGRRVFRLDRAIQVVGRDEAADVVIDDPTVSRRHALVQVEEGRVRVTDLGSTGRTRINGAALVRDIPSTLEPGDFVNIGKAVLTFHTTVPPAIHAAVPLPAPPPAGPRLASRVAAPRPPRAAKTVATPPAAAPAVPGVRPWKWIALVLALVGAGAAGALVALRTDNRPSVIRVGEDTPDDPGDAGAGSAGDPAAPVPKHAPGPNAEAGPKAEPAPKSEAGPESAPAGATPPDGYAPLKDYPLLLEFAGERFSAVEVRDWNDRIVHAIGSDGRLYTLPRTRVLGILDRADLVRRVAVRRAGLGPNDLQGRLDLARWCTRRHVRNEARQLVEEAVALRPDDGAALALRRALGEDE